MTLVEEIVVEIANDTRDEIVIREVKMQSEIKNCIRQEWDTAHSFSTRFNGVVSRYIQTAGHESEESIKQWDIVMWQDANISYDRQN